MSRGFRPPGVVHPLDAAAEPARELRLAPIVCPHVAMSHALIENAAADAPPGRALILGAGACHEIPLVALAERFAAITLVDEDAPALAAAVARLDGLSCRAVVAAERCDLTGIAEALIDRAAQCLADAATPEAATTALCALADATEPRIAVPPPGWDLVVASCVATQLHLRIVREIARWHAERFPDGPAIAASPAWTAAMLQLSWRLQAAFLACLLDLVTADGRVYVSDTVQVGTVYATLDGDWRTPGWYRMMRGRLLSEQLPPTAQRIHGAEWPYVAAAPTSETPGLVYNVHAAVMARRP
jgi:hypothetical protein